MATRLTIGMGTYRDFDGVYFTLNALRLYHADVMSRCELIVIDNDPGGPQHERLKQFMATVAAGARAATPSTPQPFNVQYVELADVQGTAAPRNVLFEKAQGDAVLMIDSHVDVWPGAIARLLDYFDQHPDCQDLLQGPLMMDDLNGMSTHFDDVWRGGMWGTWGNAWRTPEGRSVSVRTSKDHQVAVFDLLTNQHLETLPFPWPGHDSRLRELGYQPAAQSGEPFEIPAQGVGLFACRKDAWVGFHPLLREFGGEEWYLHTKFRQAGHKTLCLPWLKWVHRFADPGAGRHYMRTGPGKIRNYILGHNELNLPLDRVRQHFVEGLSEDPTQPNGQGGTIDIATWNHLVAHPEQYPIALPSSAPKAISSQVAHLDEKPSLEQLYQQAADTPSDINEHCKKLRELAAQCEQVVDFGDRPLVSTVALLAGQPQRMISIAPALLPNLFQLAELKGSTQFEYQKGDSLSVEIPACDLLFIDTRHTGEHLWAELQKHQAQATRFIVLHDTQIYGQKGDDGSEGLIWAIKRLVTESPQWAIVSHTHRNHGLTVLSCRVADHPPEPIRLWPVGYGPGTELKSLLASIGVNPAPACDCNGKALLMDQWGVEICRQRKEMIVGWMRDGQARWGWKDKLSAAAKAVANGLVFKLNPLDPFPSLIEEAIRRAEENQPPQNQPEVQNLQTV